jgi:tetratricopeptide (TPR) repeat protein
MLKTRLVSAVLLAALSVAVSTQEPTRSPLDVEIAFLETRVLRDAADPITPTRLGHVYLRRAKTGSFRDYRKAEEAFRVALRRSPKHFGALTGLASALAARHAFSEAYEVGRRAIKVDPAVADGYAAAGDAALELGKLAEVAELYARVEQLTPGYHADTRVANLAAARGDLAAAYAALSRAAVDARARALTADLRAWPHIRGGALAFDHGDWTRAEREYKAALLVTPNSDAALEHLAELRAAQGQHAEALDLYKRAMAISPRPDYYEAVGSIHRVQGKNAEARDAFQRAHQGYLQAVEQGDPGVFRHLALFHADVEPNPAEAVKWARKDVEIRSDPVTLGVLSWTLMKNGTRAEASRVARRAAAAAPIDPMTWYRIAVVAREAGNEAEWRSRLARAEALNPRLKTRSPDPRGRD